MVGLPLFLKLSTIDSTIDCTGTIDCAIASTIASTVDSTVDSSILQIVTALKVNHMIAICARNVSGLRLLGARASSASPLRVLSLKGWMHCDAILQPLLPCMRGVRVG